MQAVVVDDYNEARVEEVPRPEPGQGEVLIAVDRVQLSVTECNLYRGEKIAHSEQIASRLADGPARILGHEFAGTVETVGPGVEAFEPGDRVYPPGKIPCGDCPYCRADYDNYCSDTTQIGYDIPGALAEYTCVPATPLRQLPAGVSAAEGAAMQPLASAVLAVEPADVGMGDVAVTVGTGVMGYNCAQLALESGAERVFALDIVDEKLDIAADHGAEPINVEEEDPKPIIEEATDGVGADVVFEAVGGHQTHGTEGDSPLARAVSVVRKGGTIVQVGHIIDEIPVAPRTLRTKRIDWITPSPGVEPLTPVMDSGGYAAAAVADGRINLDEYITHSRDGLDHFDEIVDITLNKPAHGALGPAQINP